MQRGPFTRMRGGTWLGFGFGLDLGLRSFYEGASRHLGGGSRVAAARAVEAMEAMGSVAGLVGQAAGGKVEAVAFPA